MTRTIKYLANDEMVKVLTSKEELDEYLTFRKDNDEWITPFINEMAAVGIPNEPLFIPGYCRNIEVKKNGFKQAVCDIDLDVEENVECIEDTGLFLIVPYKNKIMPLPIRRIAYSTICLRADDSCGTMTRFEPKANKSVLPINEKADRLTRDYLLHSDSCKVLYRDGKVSAALSKNYAILPANELVDVLEAQLAQDHEDFTFNKGMVSHEYLVAEYFLNNEEMEETLRLKLNEYGSNINELKAGIRFATSDTGSGRVSAYMFYDADGVRLTLGSPISMEHKGDASVDLFKDKLENLGEVLKEREEEIERLGNIDIHNIPMVVEKIVEAHPSALPKTSAQPVIDALSVSGTAVDVYIALNDIVQRHCAINKVTPTRYLDLCDQVASMMRLPFADIDAGKDVFGND